LLTDAPDDKGALFLSDVWLGLLTTFNDKIMLLTKFAGLVS